jgi:hypothetical protein
MPDQPTPLKTLVQKLRSYRIPSIGTLIGMFQDSEDYASFVRLVKEYLPEKEQEILKQTGPQQQMASFAGYFEDRYFPLSFYYRTGEAEEYFDLVERIPLIALGFGYQEYDDLVQNGSAGAVLMTYFFHQPYGDQGARVALSEACQQYVPAKLLQRIPEPGFTPEEMYKLLDGTPYQALAVWGNMINLSTGNDFLDTDEEMMANSVLPEWCKENVDYYTRAWAEAQAIQAGTNPMAEQFEKRPVDFLKEVIDFIIKQQEELDGANSKPGATALPVGTT